MPRNDIQKQGRILMLPVDCIEPSPYQARTAFDEPEIAALAVSILQNGLLQPISVRRVGLHKYQLVAGERRLRACRLAKLDKVPAILADYDDSESAALGLLENLQRSQLDRLVDQMLAAPNGPSPCRRTIPMVRDVRFFVNTLQHAVDLMTQKGIAATTRCDKHDGCLEYIVRIPVSSDGTAGKVENGAKEEEGEFEVKV